MKGNLKETVKAIIADTLHVEKNIITDSMSVSGIEEWDSMGNMAIISALEEYFKVDFPLEDLYELTSVDSFVKKIEEIWYDQTDA